MKGRNDINAGRASGILLVIIVLLLSGGIVFALSFLDRDPIEEAISGDRVINTLFVLEDGRQPLGTWVLMYYPRTRKAAIFNIPGEVGRILRSIDRVDRIDRVYNPLRMGPYEREIETLLGVEISYYVILTTDSLVRLVDLLEGVDIFIPAPVALYDPENRVFFPSGLVRLDGDKARAWVRYRNPDAGSEDDAGARRQRFFLGLIKRLSQSSGIFASPVLQGIFGETINTAMSPRTWLRVFNEFANMDMDRITVQSVGGIRREVSGQPLLIPWYEGSQIKEFVRHALASLTRQSEGSGDERVFTVEVLNGTGVAGLAGRTAELLRGFGYDVISVGNADHPDHAATQVIDRSGFRSMAENFAGVIRCKNIRFETPAPQPGETVELTLQSLEYRADITLILGSDFNGRYVSGG